MPKKGVYYELEGLNELQKEFDQALERIDQYSARALCDVTLDLLRRSVELAPVDSGDLRGSGFVSINGTVIANGTEEGSIQYQRPNFKSKNLEAEIGFTSVYATVQHEELGYVHPKGGEAKYLEKPFKANLKKYIDHLINSVKKAVE